MSILEIHDDLFGYLKWNERHTWWEGYTSIDNQQVRISLKCDQTQQIPEIVRIAHRHCRDKNFDFREAIVREMLDLYNYEWRESGTEPIDSTTFMSMIKFESIHANPSGRIDIDYVAGDLFTDHAIQVRVNPDGTVLEIVLSG